MTKATNDHDEKPKKKVKVISLGLMPDDDQIYGDQPTVKSISLGWAKPDDPIYTNAGWNFIMGKNLNPKPKA